MRWFALPGHLGFDRDKHHRLKLELVFYLLGQEGRFLRREEKLFLTTLARQQIIEGTFTAPTMSFTFNTKAARVSRRSAER